jgi:hypothetical protein
MGSAPPEEDPLLGLTLRLADEADAQLQQLRRMRVDGGAVDLDALERSARRIRRDGQRLRLLSGLDPQPSAPASRLVALLHEAVAETEAPGLVRVASPPEAMVAARASAELRHVIAALLDVVAVGTERDPETAVVVRARLDPTEMVVEVALEGREQWRADPPPRCLADALAEHSVSGLRVERPVGVLAGLDGALASVCCPAAAVSLPAPPPRREPPPPVPAPVHADMLFGPLPFRAPQPEDDEIGTPIFEAVASAWFSERPDNAQDEQLDWETPGDAEWQAAAARASHVEPVVNTAAGLPLRRPGQQLVAPAPTSSRSASGESEERVAGRVRDRLSTYQRGLNQGRHRAAEPVDESWWAKPSG